MVIVATPDSELALRLGERIDGRKRYVLGPPAEQVMTEEQAARDFRHSIHESQPSIVVLDVRVGKSLFKAIDQVPRILEVSSAPAVILLLPFESRKVKRAAAEMGCYDVIILDRRRAFERKVEKAVADAAAARAAGLLKRRRVAGPLH